MKKKTYDSSKREESFFLSRRKNVNHKINRMEGQLLLVDRLFKSMMEGVLITDTEGIIQFINPAFSKITGYGEEVIGMNPRILQSGQHDKPFYAFMWKSIEQEGQWKGEIINKKKNGDLYFQWTTITRIVDDLGNPLYYASVLTDITMRKREEQQLQDDLLLAREVQKGALSKPIKDEHIHIEGVYLPSEILGGDMYEWYKIDHERYGIFLMDVMGHGVASSLVCMSVRSLLRGIITKCIDPDIVMKELNQHIHSLFPRGDSLQVKHYYITAIYAVVNVNKRTIIYASAGHPPGFLLEENGQIIELDAGSIPLGMLPDIEVQTGVHQYSKKAKVILYTDGIIENEYKNTRDTIEQLKHILRINQHAELNQMLSKIITTLLQENQVSKFQDDATILAAIMY